LSQEDEIIDTFINITLPSLHFDAILSRDKTLVDEESHHTSDPPQIDVEHTSSISSPTSCLSQGDNNVNTIIVNQLIPPIKGMLDKCINVQNLSSIRKIIVHMALDPPHLLIP